MQSFQDFDTLAQIKGVWVFPGILKRKLQVSSRKYGMSHFTKILLVICFFFPSIADASDCMSADPVPWYSEGVFDWRSQLNPGYTWIGLPIEITGSPFGASVISIDIHFEITTTTGSLYVRLGDNDSLPGQAHHLVEGLDAGGAYVSQTHTDITALNGKPADQTWILWVAEYDATGEGFFESCWMKVYYDDGTTGYSGGFGTTECPYLISSVEDMNDLVQNSQDWFKNFKLTEDLDLTGYNLPELKTIGESSHPFTGIFDGNNHELSNFSFTTTNTDDVGLFGYVSGTQAMIKNLKLIDPNVNVAGGDQIGCLVGYMEGVVSTCHIISGTVVGSRFVGLLAGKFLGEINDSSVKGTAEGWQCTGALAGFSDGGDIVRCYSTGSALGEDNVAGLLGYNWYGTITDSYSLASAEGQDQIGGLVGWHAGGIYTCYSAGSVAGSNNVGGLIGHEQLGDVIDSFWDRDTSHQTAGAGQNRSTAKMTEQATFTNWNFTDTWSICENTNYPRLQWQIPITDIACPDGVNFVDYAYFAGFWNTANATADFDLSGQVDAKDLQVFLRDWLIDF